MSEETEKQYNELRKKHQIPDFKDMDSDFEISDLAETNFLLRAVIRMINEKMEFCTSVLGDILSPDSSNLHAMHETRHFEDYEKAKAYDLFRRFMFLNRRSVEVLLSKNEKEEAEFISSFYGEWKDLKREFLANVKKMKDAWQTEIDTKEILGYLG